MRIGEPTNSFLVRLEGLTRKFEQGLERIQEYEKEVDAQKEILIEAIKIRDARIAELETFCKELFFEGTYLSMLNGLVRNDSDWHFLTEKYEEMFGKESEK